MTIINVILLFFIVGALILWKSGKIYVKFDFSRKNTEDTKYFEIDELLKEVDKEITIAAQAFFAWKSIHIVAASDENIKKSINTNALSWNIYLHSLQVTFFIAMGRIFDVNPKSCSIHLLFRQCKDSIEKFNKSSLEQRKIDEAGGTRPDYLDTFLQTVYEPKHVDFNKLKKNVSRVQKCYEENFRPIRHKVFAHNDSDYIAKPGDLFANATIDDAEDILNTLYKVERVIWDLYTNGKEMNFGYWELKEEGYIFNDTESLLKKL
ncbi:hypothetical protein JWJ90_13490 [Desulfobulbus rhabdoformis]|uniref:AbiU2 domain-containing protein n=1 Tax=Desulfobulbus rhabdoformis TaxID=34032 RepID=UPI001962E092|nr:hypothetical protein [Desulfobulbus rhabdoformis]MBM9615292.1 hypothetical protein [Desulfobulbus rhabdoformis]